MEEEVQSIKAWYATSLQSTLIFYITVWKGTGTISENKGPSPIFVQYSRTPPYEHSAQANTPLQWTILAGPKQFSLYVMFKNPSLGEQPRIPGWTNAYLSPISVRKWGFLPEAWRLTTFDTHAWCFIERIDTVVWRHFYSLGQPATYLWDLTVWQFLCLHALFACSGVAAATSEKLPKTTQTWVCETIPWPLCMEAHSPHRMCSEFTVIGVCKGGGPGIPKSQFQMGSNPKSQNPAGIHGWRVPNQWASSNMGVYEKVSTCGFCNKVSCNRVSCV